MLRGRRRLLLVLAAWAGLGSAAARDRGEAAGALCPGAVMRDRIRIAGGQGEIALASGERVRLVDVKLAEREQAQGEAGRPSPEAWLASLAGQEVAVTRVGPPDRWGRAPAALALVEGTTRIDLAEFLVAEGWALVDAGERDGLCRPDLLALERRARAGRLGLWRTGRLPLAAGQPDALRAEAGRFAIVEGRVVSVGERKDRTYLNFGRDFSRDFSVVIPRRLWAAMKRGGAGAADFKGHPVRVRGIVEMRRGPSIELVSDTMLEWKGVELPAAREAGNSAPRALP